MLPFTLYVSIRHVLFIACVIRSTEEKALINYDKHCQTDTESSAASVSTLFERGKEMDTEVFYQNSLQEHYFKTDSKGKIEIILSNYVSFKDQLCGIEEGIKLDIKSDQDYRAREENGDTLVRVQISSLQDPTAREAIRNIDLDRAFNEGDIEKELERTCSPDIFRTQLSMLGHMWDDYKVVKAAIATLSFRDEIIINDYFKCQRERIAFTKAAVDEEILVESLYQRAYRVKKKIKVSVIDKFECKYGRRTA